MIKVRALIGQGGYLTQGRVYKVIGSTAGCYNIVSDAGVDQHYFKEKFEVVKGEGNDGLRDSQYTFSINHPSQIDVPLIQSELSYKNPVALVDTPDGRTYAVLHTSWFNKMAACSIDLQELRESFDKAIEPKDDYNMNFVKDASALLKIIKDVKASPYKDPTRGVVKITVPEGL